MFSLAETPPVETPRSNISLPSDPRNFPSTFDSNANHLLPGVPLPAGALDPEGVRGQFSGNGRPRLANNSSTTGVPGFAGMLLQSGSASSTNPRGNPEFANQQRVASESTPLAPATMGDWSIVDSSNGPPLSPVNVFYGVTCVSASDCWAVGYYEAGLGNPWHTLTEHWDGASWRIVSSPNTDHAQRNYLDGVVCLSTSDCWAVGAYGDPYQGPSPEQTLIEHWNGTGWTIISSPNTGATQNNALYGVTCLTTSDCWVVGYHYDYDRINNQVGALQTLTEHWDGTAWTIVNSPNTSATQRNYLLSVSCPSSSNCWAAGTYFSGSAQQTLIEHWDGTSWSIVASPNTSATVYNVLYGVTCASESSCWAVGFYDAGVPSAFASIYQTLIEHWDGTSWAIVASPNFLNTQSNFLYGVTCASASECWAIGYYDTTSPTSPVQTFNTLTEHWDGTSWTVVSSPNTDPTQNFLLGVTCGSAAAECWAVGYYYDGTDYLSLVERWDGTSWAVVNSPNVYVPQRNYLTGVTCASTTDCWAAGYYYDGTAGHARTLIERWDGTSWAVVSSPNTDAADGEHHNFLYGVTCASASDCWAVGRYVEVDVNGISIDQTLIEHWDGNLWTIVSSANVSPAHDDVLYAVSCASASECWAVGTYNIPAQAPQTLIERWDGASWTIVTSPNNSSQYHFLSGVTCASANDCWAVGYYFAGTAYQTLIEHWDGSSWAIVSAPNTINTQNNYLNSVTCDPEAGAICWAVGYSNTIGSASQTLVEHWDGTSWAIISSPNTSATHENVLNGVACTSASDCWAAGYFFATFADQTLIEHWDGTSWNIVNSPNTNVAVEEKNFLAAVTCVSAATDCWAVGYSGVGLTLAEHYTANTPPTLTSVVSRKTHGSAGTFDVDLPVTGSAGIECRSGGSGGTYTLVLTFASPLTSVTGAGVTSGSGSVASSNIDSNDAHNYIVNLTGVTNAQRITVGLTNVSDSVGNFSASVPVTMSVLIGDTNADGFVNSADISQTKSQSGQPVSATNFREDVNSDGFVNSADISLVKSKSGTAISQ